MVTPAINRARAAIVRETKGPFTIEDVQVEAPRSDEVLVEIVATGMCHTDAAVRDGDMPLAMPVVLGHEGAGIVRAIGSGVTTLAPGDHVVLTFGSCGHCDMCRAGRYTLCDSCMPLNFGGCRPDGSHAVHSAHGPVSDRFFCQSSFSTYAIANERNAIPVRRDVPLALLGPLGCGIQTGAGAVMNSLGVRTGDSIAVFGSGAVGLSAIMAGRAVGATTIIAVDIVPSRLALALELGATHAINGREQDVGAAIREIQPAGLRYSLDTTGRVEVIRSGVDVLRSGGVCGFLGASAFGAELKLDPVSMMSMGKSIKGIVGGDSVPHTFIPALIELHLQGKFPYDRLVRYFTLDEMNEAMAQSERGETIKPIIVMPGHSAGTIYD